MTESTCVAQRLSPKKYLIVALMCSCVVFWRPFIHGLQHIARLNHICRVLFSLGIVFGCLLLFTSYSNSVQPSDGQPSLNDVTITEVYNYGKTTTQSFILIFFSGVDVLSPSYFADYACTTSFSLASLMTIPTHTISTDGDSGATANPILDINVDKTAYFDTSTTFYARDGHISIGIHPIKKYHIITASIPITYK
jgi:hypothetical protein